MSNTLESMRKEIEAAAIKANKLFHENKVAEAMKIADGMNEKEARKAYVRQEELEFIAETKDTLALIKNPEFEVMYVAESKKEGNRVGYEVKRKKIVCNPVTFCKQKNLSTKWYSELQMLARQMYARDLVDFGTNTSALIHDLGVTPLTQLITSEMEAYNKEQSAGNPISNNALVKTMQRAIDDLIFAPNEKGENTYHATSKDIQFIDKAVLLRADNKTRGQAKMIDDDKFAVSFIFHTCNSIVNRGEYAIKRKLTEADKAPVVAENAAPVVAAPADTAKKATKKAKKSA